MRVPARIRERSDEEQTCSSACRSVDGSSASMSMRRATVEVHKLKEEEEETMFSQDRFKSIGRLLTLVILTSQDDQCLTSSCGTRADTWDDALLK